MIFNNSINSNYYYEKSILLSKNIKDYYYYSKLTGDYSNILIKKGENEKSKKLLNQSLEFSKKIKSKKLILKASKYLYFR